MGEEQLPPGALAFRSTDFGLDQADLAEMAYEEDSDEEAEMEYRLKEEEKNIEALLVEY